MDVQGRTITKSTVRVKSDCTTTKSQHAQLLVLARLLVFLLVEVFELREVLALCDQLLKRWRILTLAVPAPAPQQQYQHRQHHINHLTTTNHHL
jgi:hypothetical protein